ncbi:hypothetical protein MKK75_14445 [Methylobacterium sp. J-030]|uniref:hypothetical protein n=1 Tax=Methylobacterium sp. J-030 TaxID=2836627 RepID=UPI001FB89A86|nr:hypothetical protein [Methylobacterium sp. J-030]MCJ2069981.1 hypothetical protein [Methylobacterium sp. J-030]
MRSSLAALMIDGFASSTASGARRRDFAPGVPAADFRSEVAAAAQVFADGLAEMWAARPATVISDRSALLASIASRADGLAARATAPAARTGAAGGRAQAAVSIRDRAAEALTPRFAGLRIPRAEVSGSAS